MLTRPENIARSISVARESNFALNLAELVRRRQEEGWGEGARMHY